MPSRSFFFFSEILIIIIIFLSHRSGLHLKLFLLHVILCTNSTTAAKAHTKAGTTKLKTQPTLNFDSTALVSPC